MGHTRQFFLAHGREILLGLLASFFLLVASLGVYIKTSEAILPTGGRILYTWYCTCSGGVALLLGTPTPGVYIVQEGATVPYSAYQLYRPGPVILGKSSPGGICLFVATPCWGFAGEGTLLQVGTSIE